MFCLCIDRRSVGTLESKLCFFMCNDRGCVVTGEIKLDSLCVLRDFALVQG